MARVILDVPTEKMQSFIQVIRNLGIEGRVALYNQYAKTLRQQKRMARSLRKISRSFILFDWEFFSNELEFE